MKIGIVTCHRAHNYGAVLQAYALKTYLTKLGHEVEFADFVPAYFSTSRDVPRRPFFKSSFKQKLLYPKYLIKWWWPPYKLKSKRYSRFNKFITKYLMPTARDYRQQSFDMAIYGSDQIWSKEPLSDGTTYFESVYWGDATLNATNRITYSASMGVMRILPEDHSFIQNSLHQFDAVAVREKELYDYFLEHNLIAADKLFLTIDPVFLLSRDEWKPLIPRRMVREPYLLFYDFQIDADTTALVQRIASERNLRIIRITDGVVTTEKIDGYMPTAGPLEFLSLVYYADFVVSSSFHGTAFSILFEKQFVSRQIRNASRVQYLLEQIGLNNRFVNNIDNVGLSDINYSDIKIMLNGSIEQSKTYLQKQLFLDSLIHDK